MTSQSLQPRADCAEQREVNAVPRMPNQADLEAFAAARSEPFATPAFSMTASIPVEWTPLR
jgi:hypothetical protein